VLQVEERLRFYDEGVAPRKNATVMAEAATLSRDAAGSGDEGMDAQDVLGGVPTGTMPGDEAGGKKKKKSKDKKRDSVRNGCMYVLFASVPRSVPLACS
jgi:nucleolar protein 56